MIRRGVFRIDKKVLKIFKKRLKKGCQNKNKFYICSPKVFEIKSRRNWGVKFIER